VALLFEFNDGKEHVEISLYNHIDNSIYYLIDIEQKEEHWKQVISKMLRRLLNKIE